MLSSCEVQKQVKLTTLYATSFMLLNPFPNSAFQALFSSRVQNPSHPLSLEVSQSLVRFDPLLRSIEQKTEEIPSLRKHTFFKPCAAKSRTCLLELGL